MWYQTSWKVSNFHLKKITKKTFRALTPRKSERLTLETSASLSFYGGNWTLIDFFDTKLSCFNSSPTQHQTISLETKRFIRMSYTAFRTHRWHFMKCRSDIIEMSKHKTHATLTNPRKKNRNYYSQWHSWVLTILGIVIFSSWKRFNIYKLKQHAVDSVDTTTRTPSLPRPSPSPVLVSRAWETPDAHKHCRIWCTFLISVEVS